MMCLALNYAQAQEQVLTDLLNKDEFGEQDLLGQPGPYYIAPMQT